MKKTIITIALLLTGCPALDTEATGKEEAGQVALGCLASMGECEDWTPIDVVNGRKPVEVPFCETYESDCRSSRREAEEYNRELERAPTMRSPCQQQVDSCVDLVRALMPTETRIIHNHK